MSQSYLQRIELERMARESNASERGTGVFVCELIFVAALALACIAVAVVRALS